MTIKNLIATSAITLGLGLATSLPVFAKMDLDYSDGIRGDSVALEEVRDQLDKWMTAFNNKDANALFSLYHENHVYAPAESPMMSGVPTVRAWYEAAFPSFKGTLLFKESGIFQDGNMALQFGHYYLLPSEGSPSDAPDVTGGVALVWHKDDKGKWKLIYDIDNNPPGITPDMFK